MSRTKKSISVSLLVAVLLTRCELTTGSNPSNHTAEEGRFIVGGRPILIATPTALNKHQFTTGIGVPLPTQIAVTQGWTLKARYFLPSTVDNLKPLFMEGWNETKRSLDKREAHFENYTASSVQIQMEPLGDKQPVEDEDDFEDGDDNYWLDEEDVTRYEEAEQQFPQKPLDAQTTDGYNTAQSRWLMYKALEKLGDQFHSGGRVCVLRSICEAAAAEFTHTAGVFGELLHIMFTPSTTMEPPAEHGDSEYYRAEQLGREGAPCEQLYRGCSQSILDVFTGVHDPATNALDVGFGKVLDSFGYSPARQSV